MKRLVLLTTLIAGTLSFEAKAADPSSAAAVCSNTYFNNLGSCSNPNEKACTLQAKQSYCR